MYRMLNRIIKIGLVAGGLTQSSARGMMGLGVGELT